MAKKHTIDSEDELRRVEERPIGVSVPVPISWRLDQLVEVAEGEGLRVYRKDLVGALILAASEDAGTLAKLVTDYRTAKAGEAAVTTGLVADVLQLAPPKPGRRSRSS